MFSLRWIARAIHGIRALGDAPATPLQEAAQAYDERRIAERRFRARLDRASINAEKAEILRTLKEYGDQPIICGCGITLRALTELSSEGRIVERTEAGRIVVSLAVVH